LNTARWLNNAPENAHSVNNVMSQLAACLQKEQLSLSMKGRALSALVLSGKASVQVWLRQMLDSSHNEIRQLGILGSGMLRDQRASQQIQKLLSDRSPHICNAAVLALVAIHDKASMDALAEALLHGDEALRRACAEALSNDPDEGYPTLEEGSSHPDPLVRRSVVFGLRRIKQDWVIKTLQRIRDSDAQWVVKDAAAQVLAEFDQLDPRIPQPLPPVAHVPWLIGFAAERNMVVPSGKAAVDLIHRALKEGNEEQILSALYYLGFRGDEGSIAPIYQVYFTSKGEKRELALSALQRLSSTGVSLPSPAYFGMA
jgi:HEAT repeat protein